MMTVKELMEWLKDMPENAPVKLYGKYEDVKLDLDAIASDGVTVTLIGDC